MTLPQSPAAPHRQQRWIELENVGSAAIPAFGVCEIVDSYRPEKASKYTPDDGRTVLKVRRAIIDNPCATVVNGPCEIPYGEARRIGTMDDPMLALVASASYASGIIVGVRSGSFRLEEGYCGYMILGDYDAGTETMRVKRWEDCGNETMMVRAVNCILPGEGGSVQPQQWNSSTKCWEDSSDYPFDIIDPMGWLLAVPDDCFKVDRQQRCGSTYGSDFMPAFPFGMTQLVRVLTKIDCGDCGEVTIYRKAKEGESGGGHCDTIATKCTFQACNMSYRPISCDAQEYAIAHIIPGQCCLPESEEGSEGTEERCIAYLMPYPRAMFAKATLTEEMCGGAASLTDAAFLDVCSESDFETPTSASNSVKLHACGNTDVLLLWKIENENCVWDVFQVEDYELPKWVVDLRCPTNATECGIEKSVKEQPRYGHFCNCLTEGPDVWDSTQLDVERKTFVTGIEAGTGGEETDVFTGVSCTGTCTISFATTEVSSAAMALTQKSYCLICPKEQDEEDGVGPAVLSIGTAGETKTLIGVEQHVITGLAMKSEVTSEGGGDSEDCETGTGLNLYLTGTTTKICVFCPSGEGGTLEPGEDVKLDSFKLSEVEPVTHATFDCSGCPTLTEQTRVIWAFCVGDPNDWDPVVCECDPCVEPSA